MNTTYDDIIVNPGETYISLADYASGVATPERVAASDSHSFTPLLSTFAGDHWRKGSEGIFTQVWTTGENPQGEAAFRIRLAAHAAVADDVLRAVLPVIVEAGCPFKVIANTALLELAGAKWSSDDPAGDFLTVYPPSQAVFDELTENLRHAVQGIKNGHVPMPPDEPVGRTALTPDNPWPGRDFYLPDESPYFCGREEEQRELSQRIERAAVTVVLGQPGVGKSSLVRAGLKPLFDRLRFEPIYLRLQCAGEVHPIQQVRDETNRVLTERQIDGAPFGEGETLRDYFVLQRPGWVDVESKPIVPVLIFDQFEDLLAIDDADPAIRKPIEAFWNQMASLVGNRGRESGRQLPLPSFDSGAGANGFKVLIGLRQDHLPKLLARRGQIPSITQNHFVLKPINGKKAVEAVVGPGKGLLDPAQAATTGEQIVRRVAGEATQASDKPPSVGEVSGPLENLRVDLALLSFFCQQLNEARKRSQHPGAAASLITAGLIQAEAVGILEDFLQPRDKARSTVTALEPPAMVQVAEPPAPVQATEPPAPIQATEPPAPIQATEPAAPVQATEPAAPVQVEELPITDLVTESPTSVSVPEPPAVVHPPEPPNTVRAAEPETIVQPIAQPAAVEVTEPQTRVQMTELQAPVQTTEPSITVQAAEPQIAVQAAEPPTVLQVAEPPAPVREPEPRAILEVTEPQFTVKAAEPEIPVQTVRKKPEEAKFPAKKPEPREEPPVLPPPHQRAGNRLRNAMSVLGMVAVVIFAVLVVMYLEQLQRAQTEAELEEYISSVAAAKNTFQSADKKLSLAETDLALKESNLLALIQQTREQEQENRIEQEQYSKLAGEQTNYQSRISQLDREKSQAEIRLAQWSGLLQDLTNQIASLARQKEELEARNVDLISTNHALSVTTAALASRLAPAPTNDAKSTGFNSTRPANTNAADDIQAAAMEHLPAILPSVPQDADPSARRNADVLLIHGECLYSDGGIGFRPLELHQVVHQGALVQTGRNSWCDLFIRRAGTLVRLAPESQIKIVKLSLSSDNGFPVVDSLLALPYGRMFTVARALVPGSTLEISDGVGRSLIEAGGLGSYMITAPRPDYGGDKLTMTPLRVIVQDGTGVIAPGQEYTAKDGAAFSLTPSAWEMTLIHLDELEAEADKALAQPVSPKPQKTN